jgi:PAS domain S-box-containing protein
LPLEDFAASTMQLGNSTVSQIRTGNPDEGFQRLLLAISAAAVRGERGEVLLRSICSASRECFQASGAYIWRRDVPDDLLGVEADGRIAGHFPGKGPGQALGRDLQTVVTQLGRAQRLPVAVGSASNLLGPRLALALAWEDIALARLENPQGDLIGILVLTGCGPDWTPTDRQWFQALASHASMAVQNAQSFQRLEQANRHWEEMFDAISDFIVVHEEGGDILRVNRSLAQFIGVQPDQLIGVNMRDLLSLAADVHPSGCPFCRHGGDVEEFPQVVLERTYLVSTSRLHVGEEAGSTQGRETIHVLKDVTDRQEAERRYRELFDNIQEGLYFTTPDGRFIEVNEALVRMLGYENREELLEVDIARELYFDSADHAAFCAKLGDGGMLRNHEETLRRKDGTPVYTMQNVFAVRDAGGRVLQHRGLMTDISGIKSFQTELQRERDFNSKILNNTQSLILVVDTAGRISYANRRWADLNYQLHQLLGRPMFELAAPAKRVLFQEAVTAALQGQLVDNLEVPILRADGRVGQFSVNLSPMRDEQGGLTSIVAVMTDITDAAMLQAKLMHAEKMAAVGQLVSGVAHEVNNPLTAILGFADLLMENPEIPDSARKDLRVILQEAQRTKQIVQNLLSFARQMPPQRKPVQLNAILLRTVQLRAYDLNSHGIEVVERLSENLPDVVGDALQLQQVFLNILNNAYDAVRETERPARIEIASSLTANSVEVAFRDNGNGVVSPERIFDPFFTTKEVGKGTGLGLSICYGIVREHGGEILCQNNTSGPGATFIVRLPLAMNASLGAVAGVLPA